MISAGKNGERATEARTSVGTEATTTCCVTHPLASLSLNSNRDSSLSHPSIRGFKLSWPRHTPSIIHFLSLESISFANTTYISDTIIEEERRRKNGGGGDARAMRMPPLPISLASSPPLQSLRPFPISGLLQLQRENRSLPRSSRPAAAAVEGTGYDVRRCDAPLEFLLLEDGFGHSGAFWIRSHEG